MGLFNSNYNKPGPGVEKDAPKKKGLFLYAELFFRKFWKLIQANMLYFLTSIPMFVIIYFLIFPLQQMQISSEGLDAETAQLVIYATTLFICAMITSFWGSGPASAAFAYILRCFTREEHSWILSDFKDKFKENFKKGIIVSIIDIIVLIVSYVAITFYGSNAANDAYGMGIVWSVLQTIVCMVVIFYTFMHFYMYQLMVTFESTMRQLYRNAAIFAIACLPMNILLTAIFLVIGYFLFNMFQPAVSILLAFVLWFGLVRFSIEFYAARTIQRRILDQKEKTAENRSEAE